MVTATSANGAAAETRTNADGHYVLAPLVIGRYQVTIEVPGFKRAVSEPIEIHAGARVRLDVQLELGPLTDIDLRAPSGATAPDRDVLADAMSSAPSRSASCR